MYAHLHLAVLVMHNIYGMQTQNSQVCLELSLLSKGQ
jgi:hypothetical protein